MDGIKNVATFDVEFELLEQAFDVDLDIVINTGGGDIAPYLGEYEVTPDVAAQTLATRDKRMLYDVRVREIPYHEVSNAAGTTAIIGGIAYYGSK